MLEAQYTHTEVILFMEIAIPYIINVHKGMDFQRYLKNITNFVSTKYCFMKIRNCQSSEKQLTGFTITYKNINNYD